MAESAIDNKANDLDECILPSHPYRRVGKEIGRKMIEECRICSRHNKECPSYMPRIIYENQVKIMEKSLQRMFHE